MQANQQRLGALGTALQASLGARQQGFQEAFAPFAATLNFAQPGQPYFQQGLASDIIRAGGAAAGAALL
jgi:hypothetical protein